MKCIPSNLILSGKVESFEAELDVSGLPNSQKPYNGIFIRAPASLAVVAYESYIDIYIITKVVLTFNQLPGDPPIEVVARLHPDLLPQSLPSLNQHDPKTAVALRQGFHFLTTFHPELTNDGRFHDYFLNKCVLSISAT